MGDAADLYIDQRGLQTPTAKLGMERAAVAWTQADKFQLEALLEVRSITPSTERSLR